MSNININGINEIDLTIPGGTTATISSPGVVSVVPNTQSANQVLAGPTTGSPATPAFRSLVTADLPAGTGTVTSVALSMPAEFSVSGSPVTNSGTLTVTKANESANQVYAGPTSGGAAAPAFRSLVSADLPGGIGTVTSVALTVPAYESVSGSPVTGSGTLAITANSQTANTVLSGPTSGGSATPVYRALVAADLPLATAGAFGAVKPDGSTITISGGVISSVGGSAVFSPFASSQTPPNTANFTNTNFQGGSSTTNKTGPPARTLAIIAANGNIQEMLSNSAMPASPWTVDVAGILNTDDSTGFNSFGIVVQNGTGKLVFYQARVNSGTSKLVYEQWNSLTSFSSQVFNTNQVIGSYVAIRITDDGVNRKYYWSRNGIDYMLISSEATGTFTGTVTTVGIGFQGNGVSNPIYPVIYNYRVSSSVLPQSGS